MQRQHAIVIKSPFPAVRLAAGPAAAAAAAAGDAGRPLAGPIHFGEVNEPSGAAARAVVNREPD